MDRQEGVKKIRIVRRENQAMVFVEFETNTQATEAVGFYCDGFELESSHTKGVVELARDDASRNVRTRRAVE